MCRWLAYCGTPVLLEQLIYQPKHSLIDQSLHSQLGAITTNGDGVDVGWYSERETPAVYRSIEPPWNDRNLRELTLRTLGQGWYLRTSAHRRVHRHSRPTAILFGTENGSGCTTVRLRTFKM
jgi:predicted glutamine amidotransferase